ncbi:MAG TPA: flagellar protein [Sulfurimonas sp. UBA12504]|nr:MAG: flagellar protein [Sulfurimonas sp. GWF2_37_8]DAB29174.1 MAG TPA: flagellar protein [Sulfurimonas sp. UBA12504]
MYKWILLLLGFSFSFTSSLFALELSLNGAKENFEKYSTLHLRDTSHFLCKEEKNEFEEVTKIICAFAKKPSSKLNNIENDFFKVQSSSKNDMFFLTITPYHKMKLYPLLFNLASEDTVYEPNAELSKQWMVVGYIDKLPYIKNTQNRDTGINFPFVMSHDKLPYVGGLDIKGNPVHIKKVQDVSDYLKIKKLYTEEKYDVCLELIDEVMREYPHSLFNPELLFYKIRVFSKLDDNDNVIENSKVYLREYSSDENVPEVLSLSAKAYSKIGLNTDAEYFFDRLFTEHEESMYAKWGYIYFGEMLESSGAASKALTFYLKALSETDNIELAATAAYKIAQYYIGSSDLPKAAEYLMKIVKAKPDFFMKDMKTSMEFMYAYAESEDYITAAAIANSLINATDKSHDEYERLLKESGIWLSKTPNKLEALESLNKYIALYQYGTYEDAVKVAKDSLFFETTESNVSQRLSHYDELISEYPNDSIGDRAIYEKAKLLLENEMYSDVLGFKDSLLGLSTEHYTDLDEIVKEAAIGVMKQSLKQKECYKVLNMSKDYNISLSNEWDEGIYDCAMMGGDFILSKRIAEKNLKSKDLEQRKKWLYRYIKVDFATGNYSELIEASKDLIALIKDAPGDEYKDVYRYLFDTYQRVENKEKMISSVLEIQKIFGDSYKDIDRYVAVMTIATTLKDDNLVITYGSEVMKIQKESKSFAQSPFVEFTLYQAYVNKEDFNKALDVIQSLDSIELNSLKRARQKYILGTLLDKLWRNDEAKKAYQEAIDADPTSPWAKLAEDAKKI